MYFGFAYVLVFHKECFHTRIFIAFLSAQCSHNQPCGIYIGIFRGLYISTCGIIFYIRIYAPGYLLARIAWRHVHNMPGRAFKNGWSWMARVTAFTSLRAVSVSPAIFLSFFANIIYWACCCCRCLSLL